MKLRGIEYGPIWAGSGALGFFGEGYWFHNFIPSLEGLTFVAKTVTLFGNKGNMPLKQKTWEPRSLFPSCIKVNLRKGIVINAVGLSNFGTEAALETGSWQERCPRPKKNGFARRVRTWSIFVQHCLPSRARWRCK